MSEDTVSLVIQAVYDSDEQAVGLSAEPSSAFGEPAEVSRAIELLAAVTARTNCLAAEIICNSAEQAEDRKALYEHFAALKEHMLDDMLNAIDEDNDEHEVN